MKFEYRDYQIKLRNEIVKAFKETDNVVLEAPPGSGKSAIAYLLHEKLITKNQEHKTNILMHQKVLQDQYNDFFGGNANITIMKGKNNYECIAEPKTSVEDASCQTSQTKCSHEISCEYFKLRSAINNTPLLITNNHFILAALKAPWFNRVEESIITVFDECHGLNNVFTDYFTVRLSNDTIKNCKILLESLMPFKDISMIDEIRDLISETITSILQFNINNPITSYALVFDRIKNITHIIGTMFNSDKKSPQPVVIVLSKIVTYFSRICTPYDEFLINNKTSRYLFDKKIDNNEFLFELVPFSISSIFMNVANVLSKKKLFMSATVTDPLSFTKELGIKDYKYIRVKNMFPCENRAVNFMNISGLNNTNVYQHPLSKEMQNCYDAVLKICKTHGTHNESGVIFTPSYRLTKKIVEDLGESLEKLGFSVYYNLITEDRDKVLEQFLNTDIKKRLLISPSFFEGVNFSDSISRFQIIFKTPYMSLGNKVIKEKARIDSRWYETSSLRSILQASGRSIRHIEDYASTYILDNQSFRIYSKYNKLLDKSFTDGVKVW